MASANDFYNELKGANARLDDVKGKLDAVNGKLDDIKSKLDDLKASVDAVRAEVQKVENLLLWGFNQLITLGQYTNVALFHNDQQNDTMICILEHISQNTCGILNEAHTQTGLQTSMRNSAQKLADLYAAAHAEAEITREREEALRKQIEECCPPKPPEPACKYEPCPVPEPMRQRPPKVEPPPEDQRPVK